MMHTTDHYIQILKEQRLKITEGRRAMIQQVVSFDHPFTAEELLQRIEKQQTIHRATIYRDLGWFVKAGIVRELSFIGIPATYYERQNDHHHHHFVCEICHTIMEVNTDTAERHITDVEKKLAKQGLQVKTHNLKFYGLCTQCT